MGVGLAEGFLADRSLTANADNGFAARRGYVAGRLKVRVLVRVWAGGVRSTWVEGGE